MLFLSSRFGCGCNTASSVSGVHGQYMAAAKQHVSRLMLRFQPLINPFLWQSAIKIGKNNNHSTPPSLFASFRHFCQQLMDTEDLERKVSHIIHPVLTNAIPNKPLTSIATTQKAAQKFKILLSWDKNYKIYHNDGAESSLCCNLSFR